MIHLILSSLWENFYAQAGIAGLVLIGAILVWLYIPLPGPRHLAVGAATGAIVFLFTATHFYTEGIRYEKAKWDAAEAAAAKRATDARTEAEREIAAEPPAAATDLPAVDSGGGRGLSRILHPRRVRNDRFDRDHP